MKVEFYCMQKTLAGQKTNHKHVSHEVLEVVYIRV
jgi:hypothetical protein